MAAAMLVAYLVPAGVLVLLDRRDVADGAVAPPPQPLEAVSQVETLSDRQPVQVVPRFEPAPTVVAPSWSGTVTSSPLQPGAALVPGDVVAQVDGVNRIAYVSPRPLYRPLGEADSGPAVADLRDVLASLGFLAAPGRADSYDGTVVRAVSQLAAAIGAASDGTTFDPGWLVWLPVEALVIASTDMGVAAPAPPPGTPILTGTARITGLTITRDDSAIDLSGRWTLTLAGLELALEDGVATADALSALDQSVDPDGQVLDGIVARAEPRRAITVAPSAIVPGADGRACIWAPSVGAGGAVEPRVVTPTGGGPSAVEVEGIDAGTRYLVNPVEALADATCP
jgi:hypothetical protein